MRLHATFVLFALVAFAPQLVLAQTDPAQLAGTYRVATDQTSVQIPEWGQDCGPRPASHTGAAGRPATVSAEGPQLVVEDGRHHNRTDGCWSDNPSVHRISASHAGGRWTVICTTPDADYQHEQGTYTISADATHVTMRESTEYSWQLRESRCRASATRTLVYERVGEPVAVQPSADAGPSHPPPPANRCATPGPPVRLAVAPARRSLAPGGRACFRARLLDANQCDVAAVQIPPVSWQLARASGPQSATDATIENGCVRAPASSTEAEYTITATAGSFTDHAVAAVVSVEELRSLVAQHIEDEDAGVAIAPVSAASGSGVGAVVVRPPPQSGPGESHGSNALIWVLIALGGAIGVAGFVLLTRRSRKSASNSVPPRASFPPGSAIDPSSISGRQRRDAIPITGQELATTALVAAATAHSPPADAAQSAPSPPAPRPMTRRCPQCDQRFASEMAFCPEHGVALVDLATGAPASLRPPPAAPPSVPAVDAATPMVCPTCQRRYGETVVFCGDDGTPLVRA